jgi:hypothetical protein
MAAILAAGQTQQLLKIKIPAVVLAGTELAVEAGALEQEIDAAAGPCCDLFMRRLTRKLAVPSVGIVKLLGGSRELDALDGE